MIKLFLYEVGYEIDGRCIYRKVFAPDLLSAYRKAELSLTSCFLGDCTCFEIVFINKIGN